MDETLILVVEDNEKNRKLVRDVLQFKGYTILEASTGDEGIKIAENRRPALVIMDVQLPGMSGIEALKRLRRNPKLRKTPVIAVTASAMVEDLSKIEKAGFDGYQSKPISVKEFLQTVHSVLNRQ